MKRTTIGFKCFVIILAIISVQLLLGGCFSDELLSELTRYYNFPSADNSTSDQNLETSKANNPNGLITIENVVKLSLAEAMRKLESQGFNNISTNVESSQNNEVIVLEQSPKAGSEVSKDTQIELICDIAFNLYIDVKSDDNWILSTYDMDIFIDDEKVGTVSNGAELYINLLLEKGNHTLLVCKSGDNSLKSTATISLNNDMTFSCSVSHGSDSVKIYSDKTLQNVLWSKMKVPDITGILLSDAKTKLKNAGFSNIKENPSGIWSEKEWVVISQIPQVNNTIDIHDEVTIECKSVEDYYSEKYTGKCLNETKEIGIPGVTENYKKTEDGTDISSIIKNISEERTALWKVDKTEYKNSKITVYLTYLGTEEERNLESVFPKENAKKAIVVAMTNNFCPDVFTDDGNYYDPQKFHGISYSGVYKFTIKSQGDWSYAGEKTWKVSEMHLYLKFHDLEVKINCTVTLDGDKYLLDDVKYVSASPNYIDSNDPSKTSTTVLTREHNPQLTLDSSLVIGTGGKNEAGEREKKEVKDRQFEEWVGSQFSIWDGSNKELTSLIKKSLHDEKSYKHDKTIYYTIKTDEELAYYQKLLASSGYTYTLKLYDMIVVCNFTAKNLYNATVKAQAIGVASFSTKTTVLLGIN